MKGLEGHDPMGRHRPKPLKPFLTINTDAPFIDEGSADAVLAPDFLDSGKPDMLCPTYTSGQKLLEAAVSSFRACFI